MTKGMSLGLLVVGIIVIVFGVLEHYTLKLVHLMSFSTYVVIAGVIVIAVGVWGLIRGRRGV